MFGSMFLSGLYLAWGAIGKSITGAYPFFWMDEAQVGSKEAVSVYCIGFVLLAPTSKLSMRLEPRAQCIANRFCSVHYDAGLCWYS